MPVREAHAEWQGPIDKGQGTMRLGSGAFEGAYSFRTRMEDEPGTNPEELIGAAHAGCFSMALSAELGKAGFAPETISTTATVTLENHPQTSWTVTHIHLQTSAKVPKITPEKFAEIANGAKAGCPISRLLKTAEITLEAKLE